MAHSIISDEINAGIPSCVQLMYTLKYLSLVSLNVNKCILYHVLKNTL